MIPVRSRSVGMLTVCLIIAVGDDEDIKVKVNDKVLFAKYTGTEVRFGGSDYLLMESNDILARVLD